MRNRLRHFFDGCNHTSAASHEYRNGWKGAVAAADRAILDMINDGAALTAEPAAKAGDAVKQLLKTAIDALSHFDPITAGVLQSSYALTNLPSPPPDMGSGDPVFLEDARQMGTFTLLDCIETVLRSHTVEDNSTARLAVAELRRREQLKVDRAKEIRKFKEIE